MNRTKAMALCAALALAACGGNRETGDASVAAASGDAALPRPEAAGGAVTGMPGKPGPGQVGAPPASSLRTEATPTPDTPVASEGGVDAPAADSDGNSVPGQSQQPPAAGSTAPGGIAPADAAPAAEPTPQDAVAVVRDYYAAIDARNYARARALWSGEGSASGKTPRQFADGFADTGHVVVQAQPPGRLDAAAGSRYIEVPVVIDATQRDGSVRSYVGTYTLRRAVVDGATVEQRAWRIASADLRRVIR